eukprot:PhF_6_TR33073/c0_g2_i1/m.48713/K06929/K06929; uncharacterized protein
MRRTLLTFTKAPYANPSDAKVRDVLKNMKTLVVIGLSSEPTQPSNHVVHELLHRRGQTQFPLEIVPVRPIQQPGQKMFNFVVKGSLAEVDPALLAQPTTVVDVFRKSSAVPQILAECLSYNVQNIWLQQTVKDDDGCTAFMAKCPGAMVVQDRCIFLEHQRLVPEQW